MAIHLLIIEDQDQIRKNLVELLTLSGFEVASAASGQAGLALAGHHVPDLVLCDIMMPQMDGYQVLEAIRLDPDLSHLPFVFLTAKTDMVDLRRGMSLGADDYLTKPFTIKDLVGVIESRLKRHQLTPPTRPPTDFLKTLLGHDQTGTMVLQVADCLLFYVTNRQCFVRHRLGTFRISLSLDRLEAQLESRQFFRINRQALLHRQAIRRYAYWDKSKYCLFYDIGGQGQEATLTRARIGSFKDWLAH